MESAEARYDYKERPIVKSIQTEPGKGAKSYPHKIQLSDKFSRLRVINGLFDFTVTYLNAAGTSITTDIYCLCT